MKRLFYPGALTVGTSLTLDTPTSHRLRHVLRARVHDELILFNGQGGEYPARIVTYGKHQATIRIEGFLPREAESPLRLCLAQGIARGEKMDYIIQKAVELGISHITPLMTDHSNVRLNATRAQSRFMHWQAIITHAAEQSGRNRIPTLDLPLPLDAYLRDAKATKKFVLSPLHKVRLSSIETRATASVIVLVGPEGGLSQGEIDRCLDHGFTPLRLGPRILRTETAAVAALAVLQWYAGDMNE